MNWKELEPETVALRTQLLSAFSKIKQESQNSSELPQPSGTFDVAQKLIEKPEYNIIVCGEVKKGKSSLLNAIIGRDILPVDNNIATSQVFRITNSREEAFYLVFTDGSRQAISESELSRYGSQVDAELRGEPIFNGRTLDYIQINMPIEFLPEGVSLVDTPGLGAIYKSHENITQNYIRNAAAVLFIITPETPIVKQEKEFILKALEVTPYLMFVMTKVDLYDNDVWSAQIERNKDILNPIFEERKYSIPQILPISSTLLRKADSNSKLSEMYLKKSLFPMVQSELQRMMYKAVGLLRTGFALAECKKQTLKTQSTIEDMLRATIAENKEEQETLQREKSQIQSRMQEEWGQGSSKRQETKEEIEAVCSFVKSKVQQLTSSSGAIYKNYYHAIDSITTKDEVEQMAKTMPTDIANEISAGWQSIADEAKDRVVAIIGNIENSMEYTCFYGSDSLEVAKLSDTDKLNCYKNEYYNAVLAGGAGGALLSLIGIALPITFPIVALAGVMWAWLKGEGNVEQKAIEKNKIAFKGHLVSILNDMNAKLIHIQGGSRSTVDSFLHDLKKSAMNTIQQMFEDQKEQLERLKSDLEERSRQNAEQRKQEIERLNVLRNKWGQIANEVKAIDNLHKEINTIFRWVLIFHFSLQNLRQEPVTS